MSAEAFLNGGIFQASELVAAKTIITNTRLQGPSDKIRSLDFGTVVDALCEGEIEGSATASKNFITDKTSDAYRHCFFQDLFLNKIQVLQQDANITNPAETDFNYNHRLITFKSEVGTANNAVLFGATQQSDRITSGDYGKDCTFPADGSTKITRQAVLDDVNTDIVQVKVKFNQFFKLDTSTGNRVATSVKILVKINPNNGSEQLIVPVAGQTFTDQIIGKSFSPLKRDIAIDLRNISNFNRNESGVSGSFFPVVIKLERGTVEGDANTFNEMLLDDMRKIIMESNNYPHIAYTSLRFSSELFDSAPVRFFRIRGKLIKVPAEGSAVAAQYTISGTTVTIQKSNHGLSLNNSIIFTTSSGTGANGTYVINSVALDGNSFTYEDSDYTGGDVNSALACTYKPNPYVDKANGRIVYPSAYTFNGTFKTTKEWTSDPAWILYDLLIEQADRTSTEQYGAGLPENQLDPYSFYQVSKYCNELVPDGLGGTEPRFSLNVNIQNRRDAINVIKDLCSVMRVNPYYEEGTIKITQDAPKIFTDPTGITHDYIFNNANVVNGDFTYSGTSSKTRFNVINVSYFDLETQAIDYETVKDEAAQNKYGTRIKTINSFATTSRGQAQRAGKWFLRTQQNTTETVVFETNIAAGAILTLGNLIGISDRVKASSLTNKKQGGIVKASTEGQVTIDNAGSTTLFDLSVNPTISCLLSDGTVETRVIDDYADGGSIIKVASNFSSAPVLNSPFVLEKPTFEVATYRIVNIKETTQKTYVITATKYDRNKYAVVEDGELLPEKRINILRSILPAPVIPTDGIKESIVVVRNQAQPKLFIDWEPVDGAATYHVIYIKDDENPKSEYTTNSDIEILPSEAGIYKITIRALNANGEPSQPTETTVECLGLTDPPENPTNLQIEPLNNEQVRLSWNKSTSLDVIHGGSCVIRHSINNLSSTTFNNSVEITENIDGATTEIVLPAFSGTYSLKFKDIVDQFSVTEAKVELTMPEKDPELRIANILENPAFSGSKINVIKNDDNFLQLNNPAASLTGSYDFASFLDLGNIYENVRLQRNMDIEGFVISDQFDSIPDLDIRQDFDGGGSSGVNADLTVQFSNNGFDLFPPSPQKLFNAYFLGRYFKFVSNLRSLNSNDNLSVKILGVQAFLQLRSENNHRVLDGSGNPTTTIGYGPLQSGTSASGLNVYYANPFFTGTIALHGSGTAFMPTISITPYNLLTVGSNIRFDISAETREKFNIIFKDSSGNPVDVKFAFQALGYGKGA